MTKRELKAIGYKETSVKGLYANDKGNFYNYDTKNHLSVTKRNSVIFNGKGYNAPKLLLEAFLKIPIRSQSQILFKNGNPKDLSIENIEYQTTTPQPRPPENDLVLMIRLYIEVDKGFTTRSVLYRYYVLKIATARNFTSLYSGQDFELFKDWLQVKALILKDTYIELFKKHGYTQTNGQNAINKYLQILVNDSLKDFENGLLTVKEYRPKPPTKRDELKAMRSYAQRHGLKSNIRLRKQSTAEKINAFKKKFAELAKQSQIIEPPE